jgi:tRNA dimethylallyltransferase
MALQDVVCIVGPTGTGKTAAALGLAERFTGGVVNYDSRQVYRGVPLVTAQPTPEEQARCPHWLYGFMEPIQAIDAGMFSHLAESAIDEAGQRGLLPLLVGGTGLYLDALLYGLAAIPDVPPLVRQTIQVRYDDLGGEALHGELATLDPEYAAKIHPNDRQRITRALEVFETTGRVLSSWHAEQKTQPKFNHLKIGLAMDLDELTPRLARRIDMMLEAGAVAEMKAAYQKTPIPNAPGWTGIGCMELIEYIRDRLTLEQAKSLWLKRTRAYAKRQLTWFRRDKEIHWFAPGKVQAMGDLTAKFFGR